MHAGATTADIDARAGARWLAGVGPAERLQVLCALLSRFSHDFRTPLNTIAGWGHLLQQGSVEPARARHVGDVIARNVRDQALMFEEFIEDSRIILAQLPLEAASVLLDEVVARVIAQGSGAARLRVEIASGGAAVDGDSRLMQRLLERVVLVLARRAQEGAPIDLVVSREDHWICVSLSAPARDADWSEPDLLELRIATMTAAIFRGALELHAGATAAVRLQLPEAMRAQ